MTHRTEICYVFSFLIVALLAGKTTELLVQTPEMTYVYVFLTSCLSRFFANNDCPLMVAKAEVTRCCFKTKK